jgi:hypothetical protein
LGEGRGERRREEGKRVMSRGRKGRREWKERESEGEGSEEEEG